MYTPQSYQALLEECHDDKDTIIQCLPGVKINSIEGPYAPRASIGEKFAVKEHHAAD